LPAIFHEGGMSFGATRPNPFHVEVIENSISAIKRKKLFIKLEGTI
jgi:hypothetical protein